MCARHLVRTLGPVTIGTQCHLQDRWLAPEGEGQVSGAARQDRCAGPGGCSTGTYEVTQQTGGAMEI